MKIQARTKYSGVTPNTDLENNILIIRDFSSPYDGYFDEESSANYIYYSETADVYIRIEEVINYNDEKHAGSYRVKFENIDGTPYDELDPDIFWTSSSGSTQLADLIAFYESDNGYKSLADGQSVNANTQMMAFRILSDSITAKIPAVISRLGVNTNDKLTLDDKIVAADVDAGDSFDNAEVLRKFKEVREYVDGFDPDTATDEEKNNPANIKSSRLEWNESEIGGKDDRIDKMLGISNANNAEYYTDIIPTLELNLDKKVNKGGDTMNGSLTLANSSVLFGDENTTKFEIVSNTDDNTDYLEFKIVNND